MLATSGVGARHRLRPRTEPSYERHRLVRPNTTSPFPGLPPALDGLRLGLITDVHHSATVSAEDVTPRRERAARARNRISIVLGGDYVTYGDRRFVGPVAECSRRWPTRRMGSFAVLGNHDDDRDMPAALVARAGSPCCEISARPSRSAAKPSISPASASGRAVSSDIATCSAAAGRRPFCSRTIRDGW